MRRMYGTEKRSAKPGKGEVEPKRRNKSSGGQEPGEGKGEKAAGLVSKEKKGRH